MENLLFAGGAQRLERPFGMARPARASVTKIQPAHRVVRSRVPSNLPADSGNRSVGDACYLRKLACGEQWQAARFAIDIPSVNQDVINMAAPFGFALLDYRRPAGTERHRREWSTDERPGPCRHIANKLELAERTRFAAIHRRRSLG